MRTRRRRPPGIQSEDATARGHLDRPVLLKLAAILLAVAAASIGLLPVLLLDGGPKGAGPGTTSWPMPPLTARTVGGGGWVRETNDAAPAAFIYVDRECVHCKAEMERWQTLAPEFDFTPHVWVVASPGSEMDEVRWVPPSLRRQTIHDSDGSIRARLGVRAVPTTFWVDASDTVRIVQVGQSSRQVLMDNILTIRDLEMVNE